MPDPAPTSAGNVLRLAAKRSPPLPPLPFSWLKSKTKSSFLGRSLKRSEARSERNNFCVRSGSLGDDGAAGGDGGGEEGVVFCLLSLRASKGAARVKEEARMAVITEDVKCMVIIG